MLVPATAEEGAIKALTMRSGPTRTAALARAFAPQPSIIFMDEPFGALDALTREKMNLELLRITEGSSITVVFVTHNITEAVFLGTRVVVLTAGPVVYNTVEKIQVLLVTFIVIVALGLAVLVVEWLVYQFYRGKP